MISAKLSERDTISVLTLLVIILVEGFVTIAVEILSIRQLLPFVGNNVIVTSLIIGVFLLFLAIGYRRGGQYQSDFVNILKRNFTKAQALIGIGLSYAFANVFFYSLSKLLTQNLLVLLTLFLFIIVAPIVYILGQTVPIATNLVRQEAYVGAISGRVLYLSTLGSFLGAVLTSLILLNFFGVAWTVMLQSLLLVALIVILSDWESTDLMRWTFIIPCLILTFYFNVSFERGWFLHTNTYNNYAKLNDVKLAGETGDVLVMNNTLSSFITKQKKTAPYLEFIKQVLFKDLNLKDKDILVLGAGGFTFTAESKFGNRVTFVDVDRDIKKVVEEHYIKPIKGDFVARDARVYLHDKPAAFDVIINDAYTSRIAIPAHLLTRENIQNIYQALRPGGFAFFNIIANPFLNDAYSKRVDNTVNSVFQHCMKVPLHYENAYTNIIYLCNKNSRANDQLRYTDDLNSSTLDFFKINISRN